MHKNSKFKLGIFFVFSVGLSIFLTSMLTIKYYSKIASNSTINAERLERRNINTKDAGLYDFEIFTNEQLTQNYADLIFSNVLKQNIDEYSKTIIFDDESKVWTVSYLPLDNEILGGSIDILISVKNGEIVNIIYGE